MSRARRFGSVSFHIARYVSTIVVASPMSNLLGEFGLRCCPQPHRGLAERQLRARKCLRGHRLVETLLRAEARLHVPTNTRGASIGEDAPSFHGVGELDLEDLADLGLEVCIEHRERDFDAAVEIAWHPVRGSEQIFRVVTVREV